MALKSDIVNGAYSQLRISGITSNPTPEDVAVAIDRLEDMLAEWDVEINYNFTAEPDPNDELGVERKYWQALKTNLALRLVPDFNSEIPMVLATQAQQSLSGLLAKVAADNVREAQYPTRQPLGRGNSRLSPFDRYYKEDQRAEPTAIKLFAGVTQDYAVDFTAWLEGNDISTCSVEVSDQLTLVSKSHTDGVVTFRLTAKEYNGNVQTVTITVCDTSGRKETRVKQFQLCERP